MSKKKPKLVPKESLELPLTAMPMVAYRMADARLANMILHGTDMEKPDYRIRVRGMKWPHGHRLHTHDAVCQP